MRIYGSPEARGVGTTTERLEAALYLAETTLRTKEAELGEARAMIDRQASEIEEVAAQRDCARAEREELRAAAHDALTGLEVAASMRCTCDGYYKCNSCPNEIAEQAEQTAEILRAALGAVASSQDENGDER